VSIGPPLQIAQPAEGDGRRAAIAFTQELAAAMAVEERRAQRALDPLLVQAGRP
jgi:hypothetical protein